MPLSQRWSARYAPQSAIVPSSRNFCGAQLALALVLNRMMDSHQVEGQSS